MKTFFLSAIIAGMSVFYLHASGKPTMVGPKLIIIIEIGRIADCSFAPAFCKLIVGTSGINQLVGGSQFVSGNDGPSWIITIPKRELFMYYPGMTDLLEAKDSITFTEGFEGSEELKRAMGSYKDLVIRANNAYPVRMENGEYIITIPL